MTIPRDLVAASAVPLVLGILNEGDSYGYAIVKQVTELSGGAMTWTDGMLYPLLHRLQKQGHVDAYWGMSDAGRRRKYYTITDSGKAELAVQRAQWVQIVNTLKGVWADGIALPELPTTGLAGA